MSRLRFIFKSGHSVIVECEKASIRMRDNELSGYTLEGVKGPCPLYFRISEIAAVIDEGVIEQEDE